MIQIIGLLIIIGLSIYFTRRNEDWDWGLIMLPIVFMGTLFFVATAMVSNCFRDEILRQDFSQEIVSIRNSSATSGSFLLGSGNISNTEYYFMFTKDEDGAFVRKQVPTKNSRLFLTNDQKPHIFWQKISYRPKLWWAVVGLIEPEYTKFDIIVPENTIVQKFEVN